MVSAHWALRTWQSAVTRYIALTEFSRQTLIAGGIPGERIRVKANFVRPDPGLGTASGNYAVFVGRLSPEKGIEVLLDAWTRCPPDIPLWIVGEGPLEPLVRKTQADTPSIRWLGLQDHVDVLRLIGEAKLLVFPSIWHETFGRCLIEAFAAGTPVVTTDMAPMNEIVRDGVTGLLFERSNAVDLAKKVNLLLEDPALRQSLRRAGRLEYEQRYSAATNFDRLMDIYHEVVDDGARYEQVRSPQGGPQCSAQPVGHSHGE
jgi:glycosyltransferase involved in cell wall biosynthesis